MTTICYSHKEGVIACDSRRVQDSTIITDNANKTYEKGDTVFVLAGVTSDIQKLINDYPDLKGKYEVEGFMVKSGIVYSCNWETKPHEIVRTENDEALGSGYQHALTALDFGCSAKEAIEAAAKRDIFTGGKIRTIKTQNLQKSEY
ncbi:proteasome subunit beta [Vibrio alginolyticus]|nr:proteasome subunit beta [Vibrio alginolyticus]